MAAGDQVDLFKSIFVLDPNFWSNIVPEALEKDKVIDYDGKEKNRYINVMSLIWGKERKKKKRKILMELLDLFKKKYVIFPICEAKHWSLAIVVNADKAVSKLNKHGMHQVN